MSQALSDFQPWSVDAFLDWCTRQTDERWELVDGFPLQMMSGATRRHDAIVINIIIALGVRLRGKPCQPFSADGAVQTRSDRIRRPDVGVDCGHTAPNALKASEPRVVFEVLSPSTWDFDSARKLAEYQDVESLRHIVLVSQNEPLVTHWFRIADGKWVVERLKGAAETLELDAVELDVPMREIYQGVLD